MAVHRQIVRKRQFRVAGWTVISILAALFIVLVLSTIDNPDGTPWIESSLIGRVIVTVGVVAAAVLPAIISIQKDAAEVKEQVQNSHTTNFRENIDQNHEDIADLFVTKFDSMNERFEDRWSAVASDIRGVRRDVGRVVDDVRDLRQDHKDLAKKIEDVSIQVEVDSETGTIHAVPPQADTVNPSKE